MSRRARSKAAPAAATARDAYAPLLDALRNLKSSGEAGFEGLIRDLVQHIAGRAMRLVKSGPQAGKDILSDPDYASPGIAIEAKRFEDTTSLPLDELKSKLLEALDATPTIDIWGVAASREIKDPDWTALTQIARERGVATLPIDWRSTPGVLPVLGVLCAAGRHITEQRLPATVKPVLDAIGRHPDFANTVDMIRRQVTAPEAGFELALQAAQRWLESALSSAANARRDLRSHADLRNVGARYVARSAIESKLDQWWNADPKGPAVLLGDEGRGKTWTALSWILRQMAVTQAPLSLVTSARDVLSTDPGEILSYLLARCMPNVPKEQLTARLKRWLRGQPKILLIIDGLNEAWNTRWDDVVRSFETEPWKSHVSLLLTARTAFWRDDLMRLPGVSEPAIVEIDVPEFSDAELNQFLGHHSLARDDLPRTLLGLVKIPRFARLAIALMDKLRGTEDITESRLVLEDWRERLAQRGADLKVDDEGLIDFVTRLGREVLNDSAFVISRAAIHAQLSEDSGLDLDDYRHVIGEIAEGHWLTRGQRQHTYTVNPRLLPYAIGLDLARAVQDLIADAAINDIIAQYEEQLRGADIGVAILRAATSVSFARGKATPAARRVLLAAWLRSQNFQGADFDEMWRLISLDPGLFLEVAEEHWRQHPVGYREGEVLAKGLANACKWPKVHEMLVARLAQWSGAYRSDPLRWHYGEQIPVDERRTRRTASNLAEWHSVQLGYHIPVVGYLRADADDHLHEAALAIMSFLPRTPFINAIVTSALTRAISHDDFGAERLQWLLRFNPHDHDALEPKLLAEAAELRGLAVPVARRAADTLLDALATRRAMGARGAAASTDRTVEPLGYWPELNADNEIVWRGPAVSVRLVSWAKQLAQFSSNPDARLSPEDRQKLELIVAEIGVDPEVDDFSKAFGGATAVFARWTPSGLGAAIRRVFDTFADRTGQAQMRLVHRLAEVSLVLGDHERDRLLQGGLGDSDRMPQAADLQPPQLERIRQSAIVAGLIGKPAAVQIAELNKLVPAFVFGIDLARMLTPPTTEEVETVFTVLAQETNESPIAAWLGYLSHVRLPPMPPSAQVLLKLAQHPNKDIRAGAVNVIMLAGDTTLGTAFVDSGWTHRKGQSGDEAIPGSYLIAAYGGHLDLDAARSRIVPDGLAFLVERRGLRDDELRALFNDTMRLLDETMTGRRTNQYGYGQRLTGGKAVWRKVVLLDDGALMAKMREVAEAGRLLGFFDAFPLAEISEAIMEQRPADGAALWALVRKGHQQRSFNVGDFNHLPFRVPDHDKILDLREQILAQAKNDQDLMQIAVAALQGGHEHWLMGIIREDTAEAHAGRIARGLTLAGLLDSTGDADKLWTGEIEPLSLQGWLAQVRDEARQRYQRNVQARHWLAQFCASRNPDEAFGYMTLFQEFVDLRHLLWGQELINQHRDSAPRAWLRHIDATAEVRSRSLKKNDDDLNKLLFATRTVNGLAPWL